MALFRTLLSQAKQISGSATYDDTLTMSSAESYLEKSLEGDLNYVRSQLKAITGETNWYDTPETTLATLADLEQGLSGSLANIYEFTGMDSRNDTTPTYSSNNYVTDDDNLELAIGDLDAQVKANYDGYIALDLDAVCDAGATTDQNITVAGLDAGSGLIQTTGKIQTSGEVEGGTLDINGAADISGDLVVDGTLFVQGGENTRIDSEVHTAGELGVSGSSVLGNDEDVDTTTIVGDLRLHNRLYVNYNGAPGDDYIYFYSGSSVDGAHLMWDDSANAFAFNKTLSMGTNKIHDVVDPTAAQDAATKAYVDSQAGAVSLTLDDVCDTGNTTDQDIKAQNFYINYDGDGSGGDEDSYLYFYDNSSGSGQSLMWDDDPGEFVLSDVLSMSTHKIVDVVDPTADQDVATKKYVDDTTGTVSFTLDQVCDNGNTTDQDIKAQNFYINHDGADGDSFLYFYDTSATGQSLMWDDDPGEFVLSDVLSMNTHKIVDVVDPTAAQDVATKKYVDDTAGAVSFTLDDVCENGATTDVAIISTASGSSFASLLDTGDLDVWGNITVDGTVDGVDIAGFATAAQTFTGMDDASDSTPTYSSNNYVTNGESLETAIGDLDAAIGNVDIAKEVERLSVAVSSGSEHTIPGANNHAAGDGSSMDIYLNGQLLQSNTGTELRDYLESGTDKVKFTFVIPSNSYLTYIIRS